MPSIVAKPAPRPTASLDAGACAVARSTGSRLFRMTSILSMATGLSACGGGSSSSGSPSAPASAPAPSPASSQPSAPQMSVPDPVGYDAHHLAAFNRLNEIRLSAGLGMLAQNAEMDKAAQAHADWMVLNDDYTHVETAGTNGFSGANWWDRDASAGYEVFTGSEVMEGGYELAMGVDVLTNVAYHRVGILQIEILDVGIGTNPGPLLGAPDPLVIDMAVPDDRSSRSLGQLAQSYVGQTVIWPLNGASDVSAGMGDEYPNPVPSQNVLSLGTPASVEVSTYEKLAVSRFQIFNDATGALVETALLDKASDQNGEMSAFVADAVPLSALSRSTKFRVEFVGSAYSLLTGATRQIASTWWFTTGNNAYPPVRPSSASRKGTVIPSAISVDGARGRPGAEKPV